MLGFWFRVFFVFFSDLKTIREESKVPVFWPELRSSSHTSKRQRKQEEIDLPTSWRIQAAFL